MTTRATLIFYFFLLSICLQANNDRYRLVITDNPATTITIGWDQLSGSNPKVYYGTTDYGTDYTRYTSSKTPTRTVRFKRMNNTFVKLTNLQPNTNYYFVIKDSEGISKRFWFKTAPSSNEKMSFIAGGDSRNNRTPRKNANLLVSKLKPTAVFFGGDMTNGDSSNEWIEWFNDWQLTIAKDGRMFPIIPARGNHEWSNLSITNLFNVSASSVYYKTTFGKNLYSVYTLNSEIPAGGSQAYWLKKQLQSDKSIWKSAQYHKPMRPHVGSKSEGNDEYNNWASLFYDYKVNLVYESDSHTVKSTWPVKPCRGSSNCDSGFTRDDKNGTIYVGEGCWGAPLRGSNDKKTWTRNAASFNQFKWVFVSESEIEVRTIKVDNASFVTEVSNTNPFQIPAKLDIWNPSNGSVIKLTKQDTETPPVSCIEKYPYKESFESNAKGWTQEIANDFDWSFQSGGTPSMMTGPYRASEGSKYIYMEASNPNNPNKVAAILSPCFNIKSKVSVNFDYHMRGAYVGKIALQIKKPTSTWKTIWKKAASQGNQWLKAKVFIDREYITNGVQFRFYGVTGISWQGDIAIDNFTVGVSPTDYNSNTGNSASEITLYPNPVNDILFITTPNIFGPIEVTVSDLSGNIIMNKRGRILVTSELKKGIYSVIIKNSKGVLLTKKKLVKN